MAAEWQERKQLVASIKELLFDKNKVDPGSYDKAQIIAAKSLDRKFYSIEEDDWLTYFRRAACEWNLDKDHEEVEARHRNESTNMEDITNNNGSARKSATKKNKKVCLCYK